MLEMIKNYLKRAGLAMGAYLVVIIALYGLLSFLMWETSLLDSGLILTFLRLAVVSAFIAGLVPTDLHIRSVRRPPMPPMPDILKDAGYVDVFDVAKEYVKDGCPVCSGDMVNDPPSAFWFRCMNPDTTCPNIQYYDKGELERSKLHVKDAINARKK